MEDVQKVYLGFDHYRLQRTFSYAMRENLVQNLHRADIRYTFHAEDDFDLAVFASAEDMISQLPKIEGKNVRKCLLAGFDVDDFNDDPAASKFLSDASINCANKADYLVTFFESQMRALLRMGIRKEIRLVQPKPTFLDDDIPQAEKDAFRSYYRIPKGRKVIVSFGFQRDMDSVAILDNLSRVLPDYEFLCFGYQEKDFLRQKMQERLSHQTNIRYVESLPEELYHSALVSVDALFFPQIFLTYPIVILDFIAHNVPIVSYRAIDLPELVNENTALHPTSFAELYKALRDIQDVNKAKNAKAHLLPYML